MTITTADLRANGLDVDAEGNVTPRARPAARTGLVVCFDPSLNHCGAAAMRWSPEGLEWLCEVHAAPRKRMGKGGGPGPFGEEALLLNLRLHTMRCFAGGLVRRAFDQFGSAEAAVLIEGAFYRRSRKARAEDVVKYGMAVGAIHAGASRWFPGACIVPPDWASRTLLGKGASRDPKPARWRAARDLIGGDAWGAPKPEDIKPHSGDSHVADAKAMAVAWAYRQGAFA